jgi:hypothetical protein
MAKPQPISKFVVCSECGLPWDDHTEHGKTLQDCIRLLKLELAKRPVFQSISGTTGVGPRFYNANITSAA